MVNISPSSCSLLFIHIQSGKPSESFDERHGHGGQPVQEQQGETKSVWFARIYWWPRLWHFAVQLPASVFPLILMPQTLPLLVHIQHPHRANSSRSLSQIGLQELLCPDSRKKCYVWNQPYISQQQYRNLFFVLKIRSKRNMLDETVSPGMPFLRSNP